MNYINKIKEKEELKNIIKQHKADSKKVVQCHGCFDILHPGHIRYLEWSKKQGDILIVSLTSDKYILKGDDRPYMPQELRLNTVAALQFVDYVYLDDHSWAGPILEFLQPDIYVKGKEYETVFTGRFGEERKIVESYGGQVLFSSGDVVFSSSQIISDFKKKFSFNYELFKIFCERNKISLDNLKNTIQLFKNNKILIIGDVILDEYQYSEVINVSGEAPILTIRPLKEKFFTGGAGIVAKHIHQLGGNAVLFSFTGNDPASDYLEQDLANHGVTFNFLKKDNVPTIRKVRFIGDNQKILKIDYSKSIVLTKEEEDKIIGDIINNFKDVNCFLFIDFGYGYVSNRIIKEITKFGNDSGKLVIADTSSTMGGNISKYSEIFLVTPTEKEIRMAMDDNVAGLSVIANRYLKKTGNKNILITLGANGLLIFKNQRFKIRDIEEEHLQHEYIPALEKNAVDPMGAGDAMIAMISLALTSGASLEAAAYLGSICSYLEINKVGNIAIHIDEVFDFLYKRMELTSGI